MIRWRVGVLILLMAVASACTPRPVVPPAPTGPRYPDFTYPTPPGRIGDERLRLRHEHAWQLLQAGSLREADDEYSAIVRKSPAFYPGAVGLGYALVAEGRQKEAVASFDMALRVAPHYAPGLAGRGEALLLGGQRDLALASFEAALAADPSLPELRRRIEVLRFARVRDMVAAATRAADSGHLEDARRQYEAAIATSPDTAFLYRDLGLVELRSDADAAAVEHLQKAAGLDPGDVRTQMALADAYEKRADPVSAQAALERAYAIAPSDALRQRIDRTRDHADLARLPGEFKAIPGLAQLTRGDLAALVAVRLQALVAASGHRSTVVATDVRGHWAATWIVSVTRAGLMDVYPNHTFQPYAAVRRVDLAQLVSRALAVAGSDAGRTAGGRPAIGDMGADHLRYGDVAAAVASGVLPLEGGLFKPSRPVSGREAEDAIQRLERATARTRRESR